MIIGFIGLGHMGYPMACNLLKNKQIVIVYDKSEDALINASHMGAQTVNSIAEVAQAADIVITMLPTPEVVQKVMIDPDGIFKNAKEGTLIIDCSSSDPHLANDLAAEANFLDLKMLDAPVSGGVPGATAGTLTFMVGGFKEHFEEARPVLSYMGSNIVHCGPSGTGQVAKLCNNLLLGVSTVAVSESMSLGAKLGLDPKILAGIINTSSGRCWVSEVYNPYPNVVETSPASNDFKGGFATDLMIKDLNLVLNAAYSAEQPLPMAALSKQVFQFISRQGDGTLDITSVIKMFKHDKM
ncbi:3-hydroxyisobutyrate dehydrogenase [Marinobacter salarius]|uniref:3-hydroxyisobutyrate dehydrogenase n=1 Tax=Marinobacter salarius TaxID=1420917 RepID=UPI00273BA76F|nr:3-hydroxyisobutyrate dehydrogenase [Marinobacter salarius]MDP4532895.1 3-hydroxyisobutyrate dehydrogenase [Marinobacter salarius]